MFGISYGDVLKGSAESVGPENPFFHEGSVVSKLDADRAQDLLNSIFGLGVTGEIDILAESAGAMSALLVAKALMDAQKNADTTAAALTVRNILLVDPTGLDGRSYAERHTDAVRGKIHERLARETLKSIGVLEPAKGFVAVQRAERPGQRSVAKTQVSRLLKDVAGTVGDTDLTGHPEVRVTSDINDKAILTKRLAKNNATARFMLVGTDKGGHGLGMNSHAHAMAIKEMHEMELTYAD